MGLELDAKGLLSIDVHDVDLPQVESLFGKFQKTSRRANLYSKLIDYVTSLRQADISGHLIIDGSFVMACIDEPDDIDVVLVLPESWDMSQDLRPFQYNLISKKNVKRSYPIEVFAVQKGTAAERSITDFFHQINVKWYEPFDFPAGSQKGLLRVTI